VHVRYAPLAALLGVIVIVAACSSSSSPPAHPPVTADCQLPTIGSASGPPCPGICIASIDCDGSAPSCPAGFRLAGGGCANGATCCTLSSDGGGEGGAADGASDALADAPADGAVPVDASDAASSSDSSSD
jgi:hypothetical protein